MLEYIVVKLCEHLPLDITLFQKRGECNKPNKICCYCIKNSSNTYFCHKKTYTLKPV